MKDKENNIFNEIYYELYNKYFEKFEKMRLKEKKKLKFIISGLLLIFFAYGVSSFEEENKYVLILIAGILGAIGSILLYIGIKQKSNYEEEYKNQVIKEFLSKILPNFKYVPYEDLNNINNMVNQYTNAQFDIRKFNRSESDDYIYGNYKNMEMSICNLHTFYEYFDKYKKERRFEERFLGIFTNIKIENKENIDIKILNKENNVEENRNIIKMDNDEFNEKFIVIANSEMHAYEILTLDVIQILNDLEKENIKFDISIIDNNINFRFYNSSFFEPSINKPVMKKENFYKYYILLKFILKFSKTINNIYGDLNF